MKKLMMAAAIVCAAAGVQAATVDWSSNAALKGIDATKMADGLENGEKYNADGGLVTGSGWQAYGSGELSYLLTLTYDLGSGEVVHKFGTEIDGSTLKKNGGLGANGKIATKITDALFDEANRGVAYHWDLVLTETGTDGQDQAFTITASYGNDDVVQANADIYLSVDAPSKWTATVGSVPEPTSGLLLLLGVAGLALRRRRA